jgi:ATP-dependent DNA ligase
VIRVAQNHALWVGNQVGTDAGVKEVTGHEHIRTLSAVIDGEAVSCDEACVALFEKLHSRAHDDQVILCAFDLLELDGEDWRPRPLEERKAKLQKLLTGARAGIQFSEHLEGDDMRASSGPRESSRVFNSAAHRRRRHRQGS